jgi:hypothetical protein
VPLEEEEEGSYISVGVKNWRTMQRKGCEEEEMEGRKEGRKKKWMNE